MNRTGQRLPATVLAVGLVVGCSPGRSTEAFCATLASEKEAFVSKYDRRLQDLENGPDDLASVFSGLASGIESLGDAGVIFKKLAEVAPEDIRADVEVIKDSMDPQRQAEQVKDMVSNPLAALAGGITGGIMSAGSWQRVDQYIQDNC